MIRNRPRRSIGRFWEQTAAAAAATTTAPRTPAAAAAARSHGEIGAEGGIARHVERGRQRRGARHAHGPRDGGVAADGEIGAEGGVARYIECG